MFPQKSLPLTDTETLYEPSIFSDDNILHTQISISYSAWDYLF